MNVSIKESVSSICANDLSVSLTDTEPDCIPFRVDSNIFIISCLIVRNIRIAILAMKSVFLPNF